MTLPNSNITKTLAATAAAPTLVSAAAKVVCVGRNYAEHIAELGNKATERPLLFIKPAFSVVSIHAPIASMYEDVPRHKSYAVHYETELCLRLGHDLSQACVNEVKQTAGLIDAVTLGLDLTLRDLQTELKQQGHPWERAKCFDGACVLADWVDSSECGDFTAVNFQLLINERLAQDGHSNQMLLPVYALLSEMSYAFSLQAGDIIMTGTPAGVGVLQAGDTLSLKLQQHTWGGNVA